MIRRLLLASVVLACGCLMAAPIELVQNGGVEDPIVTDGGHWHIYTSIPGWTVDPVQGIEVWRHLSVLDPQSGDQNAELRPNQNTWISQTLATDAGVQYQLSFYYAPMAPGSPRAPFFVPMR
jgi:hypothetical protein